MIRRAALAALLLLLPLTAAAEETSVDKLFAKPEWMEYKNPYIGEQNDLANPHRSTDEILSWAEQRSTDFLSFAAGEMTTKLETMKKDFIQQGWTSYASYLRKSNLFDMVYNQGYSVATIIDGRAMLVGGGVSGGTYHWLVSAPLLITFMKKNADDQLAPVGSGHYILTMQIGRVKKGGDENNIAIESWELKRNTSTSN